MHARVSFGKIGEKKGGVFLFFLTLATCTGPSHTDTPWAHGARINLHHVDLSTAEKTHYSHTYTSCTFVYTHALTVELLGVHIVEGALRTDTEPSVDVCVVCLSTLPDGA